MALDRSRYYYTLAAMLLLFGLTLPLSKSAGNVILFLSYTIGVTGFLLNKNFKEVIYINSRQPLMLAFSLYFLVALVGVLFTNDYSDGFHVANKFFSLPAIYFMASVLIQSLYSEEKRNQNAEYILLSFLIGLMILNGIGIMTFLGIIGKKQYVTPLAPSEPASYLVFEYQRTRSLHSGFLSAVFALWQIGPRQTISWLFHRPGHLLYSVIHIENSMVRYALTSVIMAFLASKNKKIIFISVVAAAVAGGHHLSVHSARP